MSKYEDISAPPNEIGRQSAELAALRRMLVASQGTFSLSIAICNSPSLRDYLIAELKQELESIQVVDVDENVTDLLDLVDTNVLKGNRTGVFIVNLEKSLPSDRKEHKVLQVLNATRERWRSEFSCPVVFWLPEYAATLLSVHARDVWSWVSHHFEFISEQATAAAGTLDAYAGDISSAGRLDADQKRFRIAELEARIEDAGDPIRPELVQHVLTWLNELVYIYYAIGELDKAELTISKSVKISEKLGLQERKASSYGNLGLIYTTRGEFDKAEEMFLKIVEIHKKLGSEERLASDYGNIGLIYRTRGDLDKAEEMHKKALEIDKSLGRLEGIASDYGNLGNVYLDRGDLEKAEQMFLKILELHKKLGSQQGIARDYGNLGNVYLDRGDLEKAEEMHKKALEIDQRIGTLEGQANRYGNLGVIYQIRGDLDKAEQMYKKSLQIAQKVGLQEATANSYGNLGLVYEARGDIETAQRYWEKAMDLYKKIGMPHMVQKVEGWIEGITPGHARG